MVFKCGQKRYEAKYFTLQKTQRKQKVLIKKQTKRFWIFFFFNIARQLSGKTWITTFYVSIFDNENQPYLIENNFRIIYRRHKTL